MGKTKKSRSRKSRHRKSRTGPRNITVADLKMAITSKPSYITPRLALAEYYFRTGQKGKILSAFDNFDDSILRGAAAELNLLNRFRAFGEAHSGNPSVALGYAQQVLESDPDCLDALFVKAFVELSSGLFEDARETATRYVDLFGQESKTAQQLTRAPAFLAQVLNFLGSAAQENGQLEDAARHFSSAIETDPGNHSPYLNLIDVLRQSGNNDRARQIHKQALATCRDTEQLREAGSKLSSGNSVSACMIVKNEEKMLPECLESIRAWVDEIIIVDTGSTDRTIKIAEKYGAKILYQEWEGNFSKHRNYSIEQATGDWVLIIDADERVVAQDVPELTKHLRSGEARVLAVNVLNVGGKFEEQVTFLPSIRLFRRDLNLRYEGIVHNQLKVDPEEPVLRTGVTFKHLGYGLSPEKLKAKADRTVGLLEKQMSEDPDNPFALFNYAQVLLGLGLEAYPENIEKIIEAASKAAELTRPDVRGERHIYLMSTQQLALTNFLIGRYERAEQFALEALRHKSDYLDPILLLGNIYLRMKDFDRARDYFRKYLTVQAQYDESTETEDMIIVHPRSLHHAHYGLGLVAEHTGDPAAAREHYQTTLSIMPEFIDSNCRLGCLLIRENNLAEADRYLIKQLDLTPENHLAWLGRALIAHDAHDTVARDQYLAEALEHSPTHSLETVEHARALARVGLTDQALKFLEKVSASDDITVQSETAAACFEMGQYEQARRIYERLANANPVTAELTNDLAGCCYKLQDYESAEQWYVQSLQCDQPLPEARRNLGLTRIQLGRLPEAQTDLEQYLGDSPGDGPVRRLLGDLYARDNQWDRAIAHYQPYLQDNTSDLTALFNLSECYFRLGHIDSAILGYQKVLSLDPSFEPARQRLDESNSAIAGV